MPGKRLLGISVLDAARQRIAWAFDTFPRVYVSFSGGKDSTVMLHLAAAEARRRGRRIGLLFVDLEGQYRLTIDHVQACYDRYADVVEPYWVALPIHLRNAVSQYEPHWVCWEPGRQPDWIRQPPEMAIADPSLFPFYRHAMEFEEFVPEFGHWYARGKLCACLVGIRTAESLNRWRTIAGHGQKWEGRGWTQYCAQTLWNVYPIYDWATEDIWTFHARYPDLPHNRLYDLMHQAGVGIHQQRICQPYGDDQRKGLWLFHVIEPETWARVVARVNGANGGALYAQEAGNVLGRLKISKPEGHTWESFAKLLLESLPPKTREHFTNKIAVFIHWWRLRGYPDGIPDEMPVELEAKRDAPSWRRVCKALLRNDYWCTA
jgi:predicted phosphoadenosine phosphosulfate sulfurtransferase